MRQWDLVSFLVLLTQTICTEVKVVTMFVQHNILFAVADARTPLFRNIFSDREICQELLITKNKNSLYHQWWSCSFFQQGLVEHVKQNPFPIVIDSSSDSDVEKMKTLTVRIFYINCRYVSTQFLYMCMSSSSTAEGIFSRMQHTFTTHSVSWKDCIGLGIGNTSVNMDCRNSMKTWVL